MWPSDMTARRSERLRCLALIMGNEDRCHSKLALDFSKFHLHGCSQIFIECGKWLIEQEHLWD